MKKVEFLHYLLVLSQTKQNKILGHNRHTTTGQERQERQKAPNGHTGILLYRASCCTFAVTSVGGASRVAPAMSVPKMTTGAYKLLAWTVTQALCCYWACGVTLAVTGRLRVLPWIVTRLCSNRVLLVNVYNT